MLLQTNSYIVPREKHEEHMRLMRRFKQILMKLGCDQFEVYEQTGPNWVPGEFGRCVQLMRFRDRKHQQHVQNAERTDAAAQAIITELSELLNIPAQQQQGFFAAGFYQTVLQEREGADSERAAATVVSPAATALPPSSLAGSPPSTGLPGAPGAPGSPDASQGLAPKPGMF